MTTTADKEESINNNNILSKEEVDNNNNNNNDIYDNTILLTSSPLSNRMFLFYAMAQFLQIGAYWLIRPVKSGIFARLVGADEEALVRIILTPMLFILLIGYNVLVQSMLLNNNNTTTTTTTKSSSRLVGWLSTPFALLFIIGWFWMAIIGLDNTPAILGWILALASECMCPILVTLNWSIISDSTKDYTTKVASSAFPIITMACQLGCLLGSSITNYLAKKAKGIGSIGQDVGEMTLLPVLLCGLSLLGVWACMIKADICHNNDIKIRKKTRNIMTGQDRGADNDKWISEYNNKGIGGMVHNNNNNKVDRIIKVNIKGSIKGLLRITSSLYVFSIFIVSTAYEYFDTAFDLQLKQLFTKQANIDCKDTSFYWKWKDELELADECRHTHFLASYSRNSLNVALLSTALAIISAIIQQYNYKSKEDNINNKSHWIIKYKKIITSISPSTLFGPTWPLIIYPIIVGICFWCISITTLDDVLPLRISSWWINMNKLTRETITVQISVMAIKAFGYTLNNPSKEMLYLHTSQEVRYQSKSWIDIWCPKIWSSLAAMVCYQFINGDTGILKDNGVVSGSDEEINGLNGFKYKLLKLTLKGIINMGMIALVGIIVLIIWSIAALYAIKEFNNRGKEIEEGKKEDNIG